MFWCVAYSISTHFVLCVLRCRKMPRTHAQCCVCTRSTSSLNSTIFFFLLFILFSLGWPQQISKRNECSRMIKEEEVNNNIDLIRSHPARHTWTHTAHSFECVHGVVRFCSFSFHSPLHLLVYASAMYLLTIPFCPNHSPARSQLFCFGSRSHSLVYRHTALRVLYVFVVNFFRSSSSTMLAKGNCIAAFVRIII